MLETDFYVQELEKMRKNYFKKSLKNIRLCAPKWMNQSDSMFSVFTNKLSMLQNGEIVYANIVQANEFLFRRFPNKDYPAQIVYSKDQYFYNNPKELYDIARSIYNLKFQPDEACPKEFKEVMSDVKREYASERVLYFESNGYKHQYNIIPTMFFRKLLPKRKICGNILPVLTIPETKQVLILPKKYWTKEFKNAWVKGQI